MLLPTGRSCEDSWVVASALAPLTRRLRFLVAVRPGLMEPSAAARMTATLDRISDGRLLINVVTGGDPLMRRDVYDLMAYAVEKGLRTSLTPSATALVTLERRCGATKGMGRVLARKLPQARDNQTAGKWRGMISEIAAREDELGGKTLAIVGMGRIGSRLATLAKAFDMRVIGVKRDPSTGRGAAADSRSATPRDRSA